MDRDELLAELRPVAFGVAYRMLGSASEAEDVVQETLLRVHETLESGVDIAAPRAFVTTTATRLAINHLRSARVRRESYVGSWLPEPLITSPDDPLLRAESVDTLSFALLVMLERLSPEQRAVVLLHDVFDYSYAEIADVIGKTENNARQLGHRARHHLQNRRLRFDATRRQREELVARFCRAAESGDLDGLEALLSRDVRLTGDGGGKVPALARTLTGRPEVARTLSGWLGADTRLPGTWLETAEVNGTPGVLVRDDQERLVGVIMLEIAGDEVVSIGSVVNPDKLGHLGPVGNVRALLEHRLRGAGDSQ